MVAAVVMGFLCSADANDWVWYPWSEVSVRCLRMRLGEGARMSHMRENLTYGI
jgi:hypothetical protein